MAPVWTMQGHGPRHAAFARKAASIEIAGPPRRRYNKALRALASLPIAIQPA